MTLDELIVSIAGLPEREQIGRMRQWIRDPANSKPDIVGSLHWAAWADAHVEAIFTMTRADFDQMNLEFPCPSPSSKR